MDLQLSEYQSLMIDSFRDFFTRNASAETVRSAEKSSGHDPSLWRRFVELGGHTLSLPEAAGGGGGTLLDAVLLGIESGRRVAPIPYADTVAALRLVAAAAGALPDDLARGGPVTLAGPGSRLERDVGGRISGSVPFTRSGAVAEHLVATVDGVVVLVALDGDGVERTPMANLGRLPMASVELAGVVPAGSWPIADPAPAVARAEARVLAGAELVGAGRGAFDLALEHVKSRHQFDRPIGSFQAIQHRLADRITALDGAELLLIRAASYGDDPGHLVPLSALALLRAGDAGERSAKESLQFFGGYGFTVEYDAHLYLRFAKAVRVLASDDQVVDDALAGRVPGQA